MQRVCACQFKFSGSSPFLDMIPFCELVDDYLEFCAERGEDPEKPFSGRFVVRIEPELHKTIAVEARKRGKSINSLVSEALSKAMEETTQQSA
ncbi:MAG: type II toxin-antitoxin system HicB family antitoxin [Desulfobacterales bacterium]